MSELREDRLLKAIAYLFLVLLAISGLVWPVLYYTRNEAVIRTNIQLTQQYQQLQQQAQQAVAQLQQEVRRLQATQP